MPDWRSTLIRLAADIESKVDARRARRAGRDPGNRKLRIVPFRSFGHPGRFLIHGRVLAGAPGSTAAEGDPWWRNLVATARLALSDEVPGATVRIRAGDAEQTATTDEEGYFRLWIEPPSPLVALDGWASVPVDLIEPAPTTGPVDAKADVLLPRADAEFGVISDLDDTVVRTGATSVVRTLRSVVFANARTRLPFKGVAAFYRALQRGSAGQGANPIFYVSSSPWNLYEPLIEFLQIQGIPLGPLRLRDWGLDRSGPLPTEHAEHKHAMIEEVLQTYPALPFILIGDSGQEDPEIYRDIVHRYPGRICAVYIRNVTPEPRRSATIRALADEVLAAGSALVLSYDTLAVARHAAQHGWISAAELPEIAEEKAKDEAPGAGLVPEAKPAPVTIEDGAGGAAPPG